MSGPATSGPGGSSSQSWLVMIWCRARCSRGFTPSTRSSDVGRRARFGTPGVRRRSAARARRPGRTRPTGRSRRGSASPCRRRPVPGIHLVCGPVGLQLPSRSGPVRLPPRLPGVSRRPPSAGPDRTRTSDPAGPRHRQASRAAHRAGVSAVGVTELRGWSPPASAARGGPPFPARPPSGGIPVAALPLAAFSEAATPVAALPLAAAVPTAPRQATPRQATPWQATPWQATPKQAAPRQAAPRQAASKLQPSAPAARRSPRAAPRAGHRARHRSSG